MSGGFCFSARLNLEKLLDYLICEVFLFEPADAFAIRIMPHAIRPERTVPRRAEPHFAGLVSYAVEALRSDGFER